MSAASSAPSATVDLFDRLVEVRLGRRRDAVRAATEVDDVQIRLQHLVFGPFAGHLRRDDQLLGLADDTAETRARVADQRVLDVLLGDRRTALQVAAEDIVLERAGETGEREARVGVEVAVLGGHHRVADVHGNLVDVDVDAVAFGRNDFRELAAVAGQNRRHLVGPDVARLGHVDDEVGHREGDDRQHDQHGHRGVQPAAHPLPVDLLAGTGPRRLGGTAGWSTTARWTPRRGRRRLLRRRSAVQRRLDDVDRIAKVRRRGGPHRRHDCGQPVVGRNSGCPVPRRPVRAMLWGCAAGSVGWG